MRERCGSARVEEAELHLHPLHQLHQRPVFLAARVLVEAVRVCLHIAIGFVVEDLPFAIDLKGGKSEGELMYVK